MLRRHLCTAVSSKRPKVMVLAGPTGIGKTGFSMKLAQLLNAEIISADSMQVYKGFDIGSGKVSAEQRAVVPHHLVDVVSSLDQTFSAGDFWEQAHQITEDIMKRGKNVVVVGGTGFYLRWFIHLKQLPNTKVDEEIREKVNQQLAGLSTGERYQKLLEVDKEAANRIPPGDTYRIHRALELAEVAKHNPEWKHMNFTFAPYHETKYDFRCFYLSRSDIEQFKHSIDARCERIVKAGLLEETLGHIENGLKFKYQPARALGYNQAMKYILSPMIPFLSRDSFCSFVRDYQDATRKFGRKQKAFFKPDKLYRWMHLNDFASEESALQHVHQHWQMSPEEYLRSYDPQREEHLRNKETQRQQTRKFVSEFTLLKDPQVQYGIISPLAPRVQRVRQMVARGELNPYEEGEKK
ncbi:tRNA isopentenyltransferase 1 [Balamuthia mandrillaris]